VQGGVFEDLRRESVEFINAQPFFGTAIGGSLGDSRQTMHDVVAYTRALVRDDRPVHLLGIGGVRDIFHGVHCGIDSFDCVHPTRLGRHGGALVKAAYWDEPPLEEEGEGILPLQPLSLRKKKPSIPSNNPLETRAVREHINVSKGRFRTDPRPIDPTCDCYTCGSSFSRAYLHHLFRARESLGGMLVTIHNVHFMNRLMADIRYTHHHHHHCHSSSIHGNCI
jgi:queuine tRNA-ribosyltransferase